MKRTLELDDHMRMLTNAATWLDGATASTTLKTHQCDGAKAVCAILYELPHKKFGWVVVFDLVHSTQRIVSPFVKFCPFCGVHLALLRVTNCEANYV
jgi:hypothetical protein